MSKLDVLLISTPSPDPSMRFTFEKQGMPPLGLCYIATILKEEGYSVKIIDLAIPDRNINDVISKIEEGNPRVIGISCATETYNTALRLSKIIKSIFNDCKIVFGGPHTSFEYEAALNQNSIDYVVINEGEIAFKNLCDYLIKSIGTISEVRGVAYKDNNIIMCTEPEPFIKDLDILPFPDRSLFDDIHKYANPSTLITSRGCPGKCIFCAASVLSGGRYRMRSAENIFAEFKYLKSLGFNHVDIVDDTMTVNITRLNQFLDMLISSNLGLTWYCESRVDIISKRLLLKMKEAGLIKIQFGVEAGNQKSLDAINKGITIDQIRNVFRWCKKLKIKTFTNFIIGNPSDNADDIKDTLNFAEELITLGADVNITVSTPFPGTPIWVDPAEFGLEIADSDLDHYNTFCPVVNTKNFSSEDIRNEYYEALRRIQKIKKEVASNTSDINIRLNAPMPD